jgi:hypothetical protein
LKETITVLSIYPVDPALIHKIIRLSMQGPDPQDFYPGKAADRALAQKIKDTYDDVEKGM